MKLTLGSDFEQHIFDKDQNRIVSAIPVLKNNKYSPMDLGDGIKFYADNVLCEASFPPCNSKQEIVKTLGDILGRIQEKLNELGNYQLVPQAAHIYDEDQLRDKEAFSIGCTPNFCGYAERMNNQPDFSQLPEPRLRTGSFHIHLGNEKLQDFDVRHQAIRLLDIFVGVPSVIFDKDETSNVRRNLYGKAGEFRPTPYGLEYRVLGNYALRTPKLINLVFDLVNHAMNHIENNTQRDVINSFNPDVIRRAINTNDVKLSQEIIKQIDLPSRLVKKIHANYNTDMYKAWKI